MSTPELRRGGRTDLDREAAALVADAIRARLRDAPHVVLGLVGGRSVGGIYEQLRTYDLPWSKLHFFLADERLVPVTSDESNWKLVEADLLAEAQAAGKLGGANAHPFPFDPGAADSGVGAYDAAMEALGGRFDIAILSAGEDGHTASLFPDHPSIRSDASGFVLVEDSPKPPPRRVSASRRLLERTALGVMVFFGEAKRDALQLFSSPATRTEHCPSRVVTRMDRAVIFTDLQ